MTVRILKPRASPARRLQRSGALVRSILADWSPTESVAGTNLIYAATHQFGDPDRDIPARPYLGASGEDNRFIVEPSCATSTRRPDQNSAPIPPDPG